MNIETLLETKQSRHCLSEALKKLFDGDLSFPDAAGRPYVVGNFVQTIDGIVSYSIAGRSGGGEISGGSAEDRFVMGLLRSMADAVLAGSGTLHGDPGHVRIPEFVYPEAKDLYAQLRAKLNKPPLPLNVILTGSGKVDTAEATFHTKGLPVVIITTEEGAARLGGRLLPEGTLLRSTGETGVPTPSAVLAILAREFGVRLLLHEGGPTVFGEFIEAQMVDELFLTLAPQIAGRRGGEARPSLAGRAVFSPETSPWFALCGVKRGGDHLFLRYQKRVH